MTWPPSSLSHEPSPSATRARRSTSCRRISTRRPRRTGTTDHALRWRRSVCGLIASRAAASAIEMSCTSASLMVICRYYCVVYAPRRGWASERRAHVPQSWGHARWRRVPWVCSLVCWGTSLSGTTGALFQARRFRLCPWCVRAGLLLTPTLQAALGTCRRGRGRQVCRLSKPFPPEAASFSKPFPPGLKVSQNLSPLA